MHGHLLRPSPPCTSWGSAEESKHLGLWQDFSTKPSKQPEVCLQIINCCLPIWWTATDFKEGNGTLFSLQMCFPKCFKISSSALTCCFLCWSDCPEFDLVSNDSMSFPGPSSYSQLQWATSDKGLALISFPNTFKYTKKLNHLVNIYWLLPTCKRLCLEGCRKRKISKTKCIPSHHRAYGLAMNRD